MNRRSSHSLMSESQSAPHHDLDTTHEPLYTRIGSWLWAAEPEAVTSAGEVVTELPFEGWDSNQWNREVEVDAHVRA